MEIVNSANLMLGLILESQWEGDRKRYLRLLTESFNPENSWSGYCQILKKYDL